MKRSYAGAVRPHSSATVCRQGLLLVVSGLSRRPVASMAGLVHFPAMFALTISDFDVDPGKVTEILDLQPTFVARKGELSPKRGRSYGGNRWNLDVHPARLFSGNEHEAGVAAILALLRGREQQFARLRQVVRPKSVTLYGGLYINESEQCGIWLDPAQMRVLLDCEVGWGLDIFTAD